MWWLWNAKVSRHSTPTRPAQAIAATWGSRLNKEVIMPKYPEITVQLIGKDGNAFNILGICLRAMRQAGLSQEERDAFYAEATSGNYDHLLATCMKWFEVE